MKLTTRYRRGPSISGRKPINPRSDTPPGSGPWRIIRVRNEGDQDWRVVCLGEEEKCREQFELLRAAGAPDRGRLGLVRPDGQLEDELRGSEAATGEAAGAGFQVTAAQGHPKVTCKYKTGKKSEVRIGSSWWVAGERYLHYAREIDKDGDRYNEYLLDETTGVVVRDVDTTLREHQGRGSAKKRNR